MKKLLVSTVAVVVCVMTGTLTAVAQTTDLSGSSRVFPDDLFKIGGPCSDDEENDDEDADCPANPAPVPATGQTGCWDVSGTPIVCAGTGQDGEYQMGISVDPRFTDNGDGTVTDNLTRLIWLKDADCFTLKDWYGALSSASSLASGTCGLTDGSVAGDWRLPNING